MKEATLGQSDDEEWQRLNAFVDGEISDDERRHLRERLRVDPLFAVQVVGLRQLKADLRTSVRRRSSRYRWPTIVATAAAGVLLTVGIARFSDSTDPVGAGSTADVVSDLSTALAAADDRVSFTTRSANVLPTLDLERAGFKLISFVPSPRTGAPILIYEGAHGCRVGLAVAAGGTSLPELVERRDLAARTWAVDGRSFTLFTRSMGPERFSHLVDAVELLTRGGNEDRVALAFRLSSQGRSCLG